jgi:hypothetical protein
VAAENSKKRPRGKPFPKGRSPNPCGRPSSTEAAALIRDLFKSHGQGAVERLYTMATSKDDRIALAAIREVLDRNLGRPPQAVQVDLNSPVLISDDSLIAFLGTELIDIPDALVKIERKWKRMQAVADG